MASRTRASSRHTSLQIRFITIAAVAALSIFALAFLATSWNLILVWILAWTPVAFLLYGYDKMQARRGTLRVPEISLLAAGMAGGFAGAIGAMLLFRHKTRKSRFWIVNAASGIVYAILLIAVVS